MNSSAIRTYQRPGHLHHFLLLCAAAVAVILMFFTQHASKEEVAPPATSRVATATSQAGPNHLASQFPFTRLELIDYFAWSLEMQPDTAGTTTTFSGPVFGREGTFVSLAVSAKGRSLEVAVEGNDDYGMIVIHQFFASAFFEPSETSKLNELLEAAQPSSELQMSRFALHLHVGSQDEKYRVEMKFDAVPR